MRAIIHRSTGKHYGTRIEIQDGATSFSFDVWVPQGRPCDDELKEMFDIRGEDWEANVEVPDGWGGFVPVQTDWPCDSHYESQGEFDLCRKIANAINGNE